MLLLLMTLLNPPPVVDPPPTATTTPEVRTSPTVRAGSWVSKKEAKRCQWDAIHDRVADGETVWVSVGEDYPGAVRVEGPLPPGIEPGVYKCHPENGKPSISKLVKPAPVVVPDPLLPRLFNPPLFPVIGGT